VRNKKEMEIIGRQNHINTTIAPFSFLNLPMGSQDLISNKKEKRRKGGMRADEMVGGGGGGRCCDGGGGGRKEGRGL
jgi:hypothetical protein